MLYILAIFLPPVAVLLTGKPGQALLNLILTALMWIPGVIHAFLVINNQQNARQHRSIRRRSARHRSVRRANNARYNNISSF